MATVKDIRAAVTRAADWAIQIEPGDAGFRARYFLAYLAGILETGDAKIAAELDRVRQFEPVAKSSPGQGG